MNNTNSCSNKTYENIVIVFLLSLICVVSISVLFCEGVIEGHDTFFHFTRLESLARSIKHGNIRCYVEPEMLNGFGYATSLFYCDLMLYIPALLVCLGINILTSYKILLMSICIMIVFSVFYMTKEITNDNICALLSSTCVACSNYFFVDMFYRGATGETLAFIFVPHTIAGIYNVLYGDDKKWWQLVIGFSGLLMSHILSFVVMCVLFGIILVIYIADAFVNRELSKLSAQIKSILKAVFVSICVSAWFLLPMCEQMLTTKFLSSYFSITWNPINSAVRIRNLFLPIDKSVNDHTLGLVMLVFAVITYSLFFAKNKNSCEKYFKILSVIAIICMIGATSLFPWQTLDPYLNIIQFPWRLHMFTTIILSLTGSYWLVKLCKKRKIAYVFLILISVFQIATYNKTAINFYNEKATENKFVELSKDYRYYDENYLHINTNRNIFANRDKYVGKIRTTRYNLQGKCEYSSYGVYKVYFEGNEQRKNVLEMPIHYYLGYTVSDKNGNVLENFPSKGRGWLSVNISDYDSEELTVVYTGTLIQKLSLIFSLCSLIIFIVRWIYNKKQMKEFIGNKL